MKVNDYYLQELNTLRIDGAQFAKKNPGLSSYLAKDGQDPDVERLLEGFAFLTGRIRQQLDEELPEVAHSLVQLLWPNYVRPVPSYAIVQFDAIREGVDNQRVAKKVQLLSKAKDGDPASKFQTCFNMTLMPVELALVEYNQQGHRSLLELGFSATSMSNLNEISFEPMRLYLSGSKFMAYELYLYLDRYVDSIVVSLEDKDGKRLHDLELSPSAIAPITFSPNETMTPYPKNVFDGYVALQEFFCYRDKHLFVTLDGLDAISKVDENILKKAKRFRVKITLSKALKTSIRPTIDDFSLYCTPVVNLFETDAVPIRKVQTDDEYIVLPSELHKEKCEVFSVENVRGWLPSKNLYQDYHPFESFLDEGSDMEYYSSRVKLSRNSDRTHTYLRFASSTGHFKELEHYNATVSVKLLSTNKDVPSKLQLGDISVLDPMSNMNHLKFKNITIPSISYPPPIGGDFLWRVISNMSLNFLSLENIDTLRNIIQTYDFFGAYDAKQREKTKMMLSGLTKVEHQSSDMIHEGYPIRGIETHLHIDPSKFIGVGEAYQFCTVLNDFFALYCNVNSFHRLVAHIENVETFSWKPKTGYQELI